MYMFQTNTLHRMLLEIGYTPEAPLHTGHTCCRVRCGRAFSSTKSHSPSLATTNARSRLASCARTEGRQLRPASAGGACAWMVECGICCGACEWYPRCGKARGLTTEINIMCSSWNAVLVNDSGKGYTVCYDKVPVSMCGRGSKQSINYYVYKNIVRSFLYMFVAVPNRARNLCPREVFPHVPCSGQNIQMN